MQPGYKLNAPISMNANNSILVIILGKPGSYLTFQAEAEITPDATTTQVIGIAGGTMSVQNHLGDTLTLQIPSLALDNDTPISVSALPNPLPSPDAQNLYPGAVLEPAGLVFSVPATITVTFPPAVELPDTTLLSWLKDSDSILPLANQTPAQNNIEGGIYHFSNVTVGLPSEAEVIHQISQIIADGNSDNDASALAVLETVGDFLSLQPLIKSCHCSVQIN